MASSNVLRRSIASSAALRVAGAALLVGACATHGHTSTTETADAAPLADATTTDAGAPACGSGFQTLPDGIGCDPVLPASDCPGGTMATLGSTTCTPVASGPCPQGFTADSSGWGCDDVLPAQACTGATMEILGRDSCQPVGDCNAAFPPASATLFVSPTATPDPTHFQTLGAAIAAASPGAVIAVSAGAYVESLVVTQSLSLVGQCAANVTLSNPPLDAAGLDVKGAGTTVTISGFTMTGARPGVVAEAGSSLTLTADVVDGNRDIGVLAENPGTTLTLADTVVRGTQDPNGYGWGVYASLGSTLTMTSSAVVANHELGVTLTDSGSSATLTSVVIRGTLLGTMGIANGIDVQQSTHLVLASSAVVEGAGVAFALGGAGASATVTSTVLRDTASAADGTGGNGISALDGSAITVTSSWLRRNREVSVSVGGAGTKATIKGSTITDSLPNAMNEFGSGAGAQGGANLTLDDTAIVSSLYYGVFASDTKTALSLTSSIVRDTLFDHIDGVGRNIDTQDGAKCTLSGVTVVNSEGEALLSDATMAPADLNATQTVAIGGHIGAFLRLGGTMELTQTALVRNVEAGLYLTADEGAAHLHSTATMTDSVIVDTQPISGANGVGVVSGGVVTLSGVTIRGTYGGGLWTANNSSTDGGATTSGATATLTGCVVRDTQNEPDGDYPGHGVVALGGTNVTLQGCIVTGNTGAGIAFQSATGLVAGGTVSNNVLGLDALGSSMVTQLATAPASLTPGEVVVLDSTTFSGNQQNLSTMVIPVPMVSFQQ